MRHYLWGCILGIFLVSGYVYAESDISVDIKEDETLEEPVKPSAPSSKKKNRKKESPTPKEATALKDHEAHAEPLAQAEDKSTRPEESSVLSIEENEIEDVKSSQDEKKTVSSAPSVSAGNLQNQPETNVTIHRNGVALFTSKIRADLKAGSQKVVSLYVPTTLQHDSIMATFDVPDSNVQILSQYVSPKKNTLTFMMHSDYDQVKVVMLNYLFSGLDWDIFYTGMLAPDQKTLLLHGWIELRNYSGVDLKQAQILFDGSTITTTPEGLTVLAGDKMAFHYLVPRVLSLPKEKKTSLFFLQSQPIPLTENLTLNLGEEFLKDLNHKVYHPAVQRVLEFKNDPATLNMPLPEGKMTLYHMQDNHLNRLLGSTTLLETPLGESVFIRAGQDPSHLGLICDVEQTEYKKNSNKSYDMGYSVRLQNKGDVATNVKIDLPLKQYTWTIVRSSHEYKVAPHDQGVYWDMDIPAKGAIELKYRLKLEEKQGG